MSERKVKPLKTVLKAYHLCENECGDGDRCKECPYTEFDTDGNWKASRCGDMHRDAIYYLELYQEQKTAFWFDMFLGYDQCSNCGYQIRNKCNYKFCPNCGCKMEE